MGEFCQGVMIKARPARLCKIVVKEEVLCPLFDILTDRLEYFYVKTAFSEILTNAATNLIRRYVCLEKL